MKIAPAGTDKTGGGKGDFPRRSFSVLAFSVERVPQLIEKAAAFLIVFVPERLFKRVQELFLLRGQVFGYLDRHPDHLVAASPSVDVREPLPFQAESLAGRVPSRTV